MIKDISKTIHFRFFNKFTKQDAVIVDIPFIPFLATNGYYSDLFKKLREASAFKCDKSMIKGKVWFTTDKGDRMVISMASGIKLNMPHVLNEKDIKIIRHHLEGLKMAVE